MSKRTPVRASVVTVFVCLIACNNPPTGPASIARLELTGPLTIAPGQPAEYRLVAKSAGGSSRDVSLEAEWSSSAEAVIAIASPGRANGQQPGEAVITANYNGRAATLSVFVVPAGTFALKGTVKDALTDIVVAGARVQALSGNVVPLETTTGTDGRYRLYGVEHDAELRVIKEGYIDNQQPLDIDDHTTVDVVLRRLGVPQTYTGTYTLTLEIGGQCSGLPDAARTRMYAATIEEFHDPRLTANYVVTLNGATFKDGCGTNALAPGLGCNQFFTRRQGAGLTFSMPDGEWGEGGHISERLADGAWLTVVGDGSGQFEGSILQTSGVAQVWFCAGAEESASQCQTTYCRTDEFRLRFTRQ